MHTRLKEYRFRSAEYDREIIRYSWGDATFLELALTFKPHAYLCHATALLLHGLASPDPRTIYLNVEQSAKEPESDALAQEAINRAFAAKQRQSNLAYKSAGVSIVMVSGKNTKRLGVTELNVAGKGLAVTNLERTLIDIVVRPTYAGGVDQLLKAYAAAKNRVSVTTLVATLRMLNYIYPYHQSIGFLMERAGYHEPALRELETLGLKYDFYLAHKMSRPRYSKDWRLYFPREWSP